MLKKGFLLILLLFFLFLLGCVVEDTKLETDNQIPETIILPNGSCSPRWGCISSIYKAYQLENCSWTQKVECELGCMEGECRTAKTCTRGFKCQEENYRGLQDENCQWILTQYCKFGCSDGQCLTESNVTYTEAAALPTIAPPLVKIYDLPVNAEDLIEFRQKEYLLSIYILESDRVRLEINGRRSDWLKEDDSFVYSRVNITIVYILFQQFEGGTREISYKVGDS